jgi:hypothetical protein
VQFFVRGLGDLLLLSSAALASSLVRSPVQLWRPSWRVASFRGGGRVLLLVSSGCRFAAQLFGHLVYVRLPFACATGAFRSVLAACCSRVECLASLSASPSLLPLMCQLQPV